MNKLSRAIIVCGLGYFIDVFDIQLFAVLRLPSLTELGIPSDRIATIGGNILNAQMFGMILGAFLWGWLGDRFGRLKALYGSILIYSLGTLSCGFVNDPVTYGMLRFVTGFGLAGETGAAITIISEMMAPARRLWGIILMSAVGYMGPVSAIIVSGMVPWRSTYIFAGLLGLAIFILRIRLGESELFRSIERQKIVRGSLKILIQRRQLRIAIGCVLSGLPLTYFWFLLNFFSAEISRAVLAPEQPFKQTSALLTFYIGNAVGDVLCGVLSQYLQSRRKAIACFYAVGCMAALGYLLLGPQIGLTVAQFYGASFIIGCAAGSWVLVNAVFAEQFGTNIRATASIVLVNFIRGLSIPMIFLFQTLRQTIGITQAAALIGALFCIAGLSSLLRLRETHGINLDYVEELEAGEAAVK